MTPHFSLVELTYTDHRKFDNTPGEKEKANLQRLAEFLEIVRRTLGNKPIVINSAYRSKAVNDAVGSKDTSQHRLGCAADIRVPGINPNAVCRILIEAQLPYDQLIREFDAWTHLSIPNIVGSLPRRQALIIDKTGTRTFA